LAGDNIDVFGARRFGDYRLLGPQFLICAMRLAQNERPPRGGLSEIRSGVLDQAAALAAASQCPVLSDSGQNVAVPRMSALCQKQTHALQHEQTSAVSLLDL
jgi:hypothetical protein